MTQSTEIKETKQIENELCPMPSIAKLIGGKWKLIILQILIFKGTKRFNELRRMIDGVTQTMLTNQYERWNLTDWLHEKFMQKFRRA